MRGVAMSLLGPARAVIRAVAERDPMVPAEVDGSLSCFWCGTTDDELVLARRGGAPGDHPVDCVWRRARVLAEAKV